MADVQIDKLTIEIEANSGAATTNIKKLGKAIESLSSTSILNNLAFAGTVTLLTSFV